MALGKLRLSAALCLLAFSQSCYEADRAPLGTSDQALVGDDGAITINAANVQLNTYGVLAANAAAGASSITVTNIADLTSVAFGPLANGDLVLVVQMQGAQVDVADTAGFGSVTAFNGAGSYELVNVASVAGNTITLDASCGGLVNGYAAASHAQVVRVPQPTSLTINAGGSLVARPWDGQRGGVVAVQVRDTTTVNGAILASGAGFRGGAVDNLSSAEATSVALYRSTNPADGAEKGEGVAGFQAAYDALGGRYGRGAAANGGGGGNAFNAGGGGGGGAGAIAAWTGQGVMNGADIGAAAWHLDPGYANNGNALTMSSGGGRGGYSSSAAVQNPATVAPGNSSWAGNSRRERGGLGGRPLDANPARLYLGGGGGAGDGDNGAAGAGGAGGGAVLLLSGSVVGAGSIRAAGSAGGSSPANATGDAPGGGGGGGTVLVQAANLSAALTIDASGGTGGNQAAPTGSTTRAEGPGGGGGGGYVAVAGGAATRTANGGAHGLTSALPLVTTFPANGATGGSGGVATGAIAVGDIPYCVAAELGVTISDAVATVDPGQMLTYRVVVTNAGPNPATGVGVSEAASPGLGSLRWTCAASAGSACGAASGLGPLATTANIAVSGVVTYTVTATVAAGASGTVTNSVTVTPPSGFTDPVARNNAASDVDNVTVLAPDVVVPDAPVDVVPDVTTDIAFDAPADVAADLVALDADDAASPDVVPLADASPDAVAPDAASTADAAMDVSTIVDASVADARDASSDVARSPDGAADGADGATTTSPAQPGCACDIRHRSGGSRAWALLAVSALVFARRRPRAL